MLSLIIIKHGSNRITAKPHFDQMKKKKNIWSSYNEFANWIVKYANIEGDIAYNP